MAIPLAEKYPDWSPYNYTMNNPINLIDPTGMEGEWIPTVCSNNGQIQYIAEKGDNAKTLSKQFGISLDKANKMINITTNGTNIVTEGVTFITGEEAKSVTGNEILQLDASSDLATSQRMFDQFIFGMDVSKTKLGDTKVFNMDTFFNNAESQAHILGNVLFRDINVEMYVDIQIYRSGTFDKSNPYWLYQNTPSHSKTLGYKTKFFNNSSIVYLNPVHPETGAVNTNSGWQAVLTHDTKNTNKIMNRLEQDFPTYTYPLIKKTKKID